MATKPATANQGTALETKPEPALATVSQKFLKKVEDQFAAELGQSVLWTPLQATLAQHLFIKINQDLTALQAKGKDIGWHNVNMPKLAIDATHRVNLELDGMIKNHIHTIPYLNGKLSKQSGRDVYDLDLRIGFEGMLYSRVRASVDKIVDVVCKLVYETDTFEPVYKSATNQIEAYVYRQGSPFNPGEPVGGFGYISYEDPRKNKLVIVTQRDFERSRKAGNRDFWGWDDYEDSGTGKIVKGEEKSRIEMMEKTVKHRTAEEIQLDPNKTNAASFAFLEVESIDAADQRIGDEAEALANKTMLALDVAAEEVQPQEPKAKPEPVAKAKAEEPAGSLPMDESDPYGEEDN